MSSVHVEVDDDGGLVAVKVATDVADVLALQREAAALELARHPGVVELRHLDVDPTATGGRLVTTWVGAQTLADLRHLTTARAVAIVATLAGTLADLHRRGVVHGRVHPGHVLLDSRRQPVLCSLAMAGTADDPHPAGHLRCASDDVGDLGAVISHLVQVIDRSPSPPWRQRRQHAHERDRLRSLAARAQATDPVDRPTAGLVALASRPEHRPVDPAPASSPGRHRPAPGPARRLAVGSLGLGTALLATVASVGLIDRSGAELSASPPPATVATSTSTSTSTTIVPLVESATGDAAAPGELAHDIPVVSVDGRRYAAGLPGDDALAGDWRCDGTTSVALLRPSTGALFLFDQPTVGGGEQRVRSVALVPAHGRLVAPPLGARCPTLGVLGGDGRVTTIDTRSSP